MDILDLDKLYLFIFFVIPGFISLKVYGFLFPTESKNTSEQIVDAVTYSCINYAILFVPIFLIETRGLKDSWPITYALFYGVVILLMPILWAYLWGKLRKTEYFQDNAPHPISKPWDFVFSQRKPYWIIVTLKDGKKIAGRYGERSFSSSSPSKETIYLEESWKLNEDEGFERRHNQTAGVLIASDEIMYLELFN